MRNKLALAALLALLALPLYGQTIRPTRISQIQFTELTTAQEASMTLAEGSFWYNTDLKCYRYRSATATTCIENQDLSGTYNVKSYGAVADGTTDDTAAIQAASDACDAAATSTTHPTTFFPAGDYSITSTLSWERCSWLGAGMSSGTRLIWDGAADAIAIDQPSLPSAGHSFMKGFTFVSGANRPGNWIRFQESLDAMTLLSELHFKNTNSHAIRLDGGWFNAHFRKLRFDDIGGYLIYSTVKAAQNQSSWSIDQWTTDKTTATAPGVFAFDNTVANVTSASEVSISNARIEAATAYSAPNAFIRLISGASVATFLQGIHLKDLNIQVGAGMTLVSSDFTANTWTPRLLIENVGFASSGGVIVDGDNGWWFGASAIPVPTNESIFLRMGGTQADPYFFVGRRVTSIQFGNATDQAYSAKARVDADDRWRVLWDGKQELGDGTNPPDTNLYRSAADTLKTDDKFIAAVELEVGGDLNHDGSNVGFYGVTPVAQPGTTAEIKAALSSLGLLQDGSATPLDLDGGLLTAGGVVATAGVIEYTDAPTLAASTTPSVTGGNVFLTNSTASISDFTGEQNGQVIILLCGADTTTTLLDSTPLFLAGAFSCGTDDTISLVSNGTVWYEISRSVN